MHGSQVNDLGNHQKETNGSVLQSVVKDVQGLIKSNSKIVWEGKGKEKGHTEWDYSQKVSFRPLSCCIIYQFKHKLTSQSSIQNQGNRISMFFSHTFICQGSYWKVEYNFDCRSFFFS